MNTEPPYLPLRNLYASQEATVRTGHATTDWFQIGKGVCQGDKYCHLAYLTYMQSEMKVAQLCPTLCDPVNYAVHGILQARILEWVTSD